MEEMVCEGLMITSDVDIIKYGRETGGGSDT